MRWEDKVNEDLREKERNKEEALDRKIWHGRIKDRNSQRQWRVDSTGSRSDTEVKQRPARLGLGWVTIQIRTLVMLAIPGPTQAG